MLIPSTITARRTRRYTSTLYIPGTIQRVGYYPMDDGGRHSFQPPNVSNHPPTWPNISADYIRVTTATQESRSTGYSAEPRRVRCFRSPCWSVTGTAGGALSRTEPSAVRLQWLSLCAGLGLSSRGQLC